MTIALFGASGRTGRAFLPLALDAVTSPERARMGVRALVRTPEKIGVQYPNLTVLQGDVTDPLAVRNTIAGTDLVVSLIGQVKGGRKDVQTVGTKNMIEAMRNGGPNRIISMSGGGIPYEKDQPKLIDRVFRGVMGLFFKDVLRDATAHADLLRASGLDWTIVRGPRLVDGAAKGEYKVGYVGTTGGSTISRADMADFILKEISHGQHVGDMPFVTW